MMLVPETEPENNKKSKKISKRALFFFFSIILIGIYSIIWQNMAHKIQEIIRQDLQSAQNYGVKLECTHLYKTGYPLRIAIACDQLTGRDGLGLVDIKSRSFVASAPIYAPHWIRFDITAPASLEVSGHSFLEGQWDWMRIETNVTKSQLDNKVQLQKINLSGANIKIGLTGNKIFSDPVTADFLQLDMRADSSKMDARLSFDKLYLPFLVTTKGQTTPRLNGMIDIVVHPSISDKPMTRIANRRPPDWVQGKSGILQKATFIVEKGGKLTISGPFSVSAEGLLNGQFTVEIGDAPLMLQTLNRIFPELASNFAFLFFALNTLPKNEKGEPQLIFTIAEGKVRAGFIRLGNIPPLKQLFSRNSLLDQE